jgi:hypothetical protein
MTADVVKFEDAAQTFERDRNVWRLRLIGTAPRRIAEQLNCTIDQVNASIVRMIGGVSPELRARTVALELDRLDEMQQGFYVDALRKPERKPDPDAANIVLNIMERRARLLGLDAPPRGDIPLNDLMEARQTSTEKIRAALDRLAGKTNTVIEGEVNRQSEDKPQED